MPTVVLATDAFRALAQESARNVGIEHARVLEVKHPIGGESDAQLFAKADRALDDLIALMQPA